MAEERRVFKPFCRTGTLGRAYSGNGGKSRYSIGAKAKEQFNVWLDPLDIVVYIDGSQKNDKSGTPTGVGAALVIKSRNQWLGKGGIPLGSRAEGYDSEAIALCKRFETTLAIPETRGAPGIHICRDNLSVAREAGSVPNGSVPKHV